MFMDGTLNIVKMSVLPNLIYRLNTILIKTSACYFMDIKKLILKFYGDKRPGIFNTILEENKVGGLTLPDIKTYYNLKLVLCKRQCQEKKKTTHRMGENICK